LAGAIILAGGAGLAYGGNAEIFVCSSTGSDDATGATRGAPLRTIQAAVDRAEPGTTITLLPGWYEGGTRLKPGEPGRPITLRGERRGRVFIGQRVAGIVGWERAPKFRYTYAAHVADTPRALIEASTGRQLRPMASVLDVEYLAGTFHHDPSAGTLYVHPSDSETALRHLYAALPTEGTGVILANHTIVDGIVFTGMGNAAVQGNNPTGATVRHCIAYRNGYAVELRGGTDCLISGNHFWANVPMYAAGSQIYVSAPPARGASAQVRGIVIEDNRVYGSPKSAIRFYGTGPVDHCVMRGNLMRGSYSKMRGRGGLTGTRNVSLGSFWAHDGGHNTYRGNPHPQYKADTDLLSHARDWRFVDPAYFDYRLQADSPARGAAPDGSDLGAFPYDGSVVFVAPDGDDAAEGTSEGAAWRTLGHALSALHPGQTLYLAPGDWADSLVIEGLISKADNPARIRVRGRGRATVPTLRIAKSENLEIEGLMVMGASASTMVQDSQGIALRRCANTRVGGGDAARAGITVSGSRSVTLEHVAVSGAGAGIRIENSADVEVVSSVLAASGGAQIILRGETPGFWSEFNAFAIRNGAPLAETPQGKSAGLDAWRTMRGLDRESHRVALADFVAPERGDYRIVEGRRLSFSGRYGKAVGPHSARKPPVSREAIERVKVISTTRTSANLSWWTPGRITGTMLEWGKTPEYAHTYDRGARDWGEYETFHTVSLIGLAPETTYHFRVGFRDHATEGDYADNEFAIVRTTNQKGVIWSGDYAFTTAARDPEPRRLYVSLDGDDANDGLTPATAWRSVDQASRKAGAGDIVTIAPGRYRELLRPLQTGTSEDRRIVFRAERPFTVFLDGGFVRDGGPARSHTVQLMGKAFVNMENLVCERGGHMDNGGYRGWPGYAGLILVSGSTGIEVKACVMDGRHRFMCGLVAQGLAAMPGSPEPEDVAPLTASDNLFVGNWFALYVGGRGPNIFRHNAFVRGRVLMAAFDAETVLRNNIYQSLGSNKFGNSLFVHPARMDSDYNCFGWDAENDRRNVASIDRQRSEFASGLAGWREAFKQDLNSIESDPGYPLSAKVGFGSSGMVAPDLPLSIEDLVLPPDSPCRGAGENGANIGPRWEKFLGQ
jgi:hypothetical protein